MALDVRLLGELTVLRGGERLVLPASRKTRALLGYLAATARSHRRERLCSLLFDGPDDPRAGLRWSLSKLRPLVDDDGCARLSATRDQIGFAANGAAVDLLDVRRATAGGLDSLDSDALRALAERFSGELLEGLDLPDCFRFHEWLVAEREEARALESRLLETLVGRLAERPEEALPWARQRVRLEPLSESAHAAVIRLLHAAGRSREALEQYDACRDLLKKELGARPSRELDEARTARPRPAAPLAAPRSAPRPAPSSATLAGRRTERELIARWAAPAPRPAPPRVLLLTGEPGLGKSRLLEEAASEIHARGGRVLFGRAFEAEMVRPYGAFIDALRSAPPAPMSDELRADLAPLLPELGDASPGSADRTRLFDALVGWLNASSSPGHPTLVALDDLQWFDESSAALLHYAARGVPDGRLLFACAARTPELSDNAAALRLVRALDREERLRAVPLAPLSEREVAELVAAVAPDADAPRVFAESEGNPLFALELLRRTGGPAGGPLPSLERLFTARLEQLDAAARGALGWAAVLGRSFALETLARVAGLSMPALLSAVEELERRGFVRPASGGAPGSYDFTHDLLRKATYAAMPEPRRRQVHREIARALEGLVASDPALSGDVAHHAAAGGDLERAARACVATGERCLKVFALKEAWDAGERGFIYASGLPPATQLPLQVDLLRILVLSRTRRDATERVRGMLEQVLAEAGRRGMADLMAQGFMVLAIINAEGGRYEEAEETANAAAAAGREATDTRVASFAFAATGRCLVMLDRDVPRARLLLQEARALAPGREGEDVELPLGFALLALFDAEVPAAVTHLERALQRARATEDRWREYLALAYLARLEIERDDPAAARRRCAELVPVASRMGEGSEGAFAATLEALARRGLGEPGAREGLERALEALREVDTKADLGWALVRAGELDLRDGEAATAAERGEEALRHALLLKRRCDEALARALVCRARLAAGDPVRARKALAGARDPAPGELSVQACAALSAAARALETPSTERRTPWTT